MSQPGHCLELNFVENMLKVSNLGVNIVNQNLNALNLIIYRRALSNVVSKLPANNVAILQQTVLNKNSQNEKHHRHEERIVQSSRCRDAVVVQKRDSKEQT